MKILMANSYYHPTEIGGAERSLRILAEALAQKGHKVAVATTGQPAQANRDELNGVAIYRYQNQNIARRLGTLLPSSVSKGIWHLHDTYMATGSAQIGHACDDFKPDILHSNNLSGFSVAAWEAASARGIPIVHTLRDYYLLCVNNGFFRDGRPCHPSRCVPCRVLSEPKAWVSKHVGHVVGNSDFIINKHLEYGLFATTPRSVVYNGYRLPQAAQQRTHPARLGRSMTFGYIGILSATKGVELLIEQFKLLHDQHPLLGLRLQIAGVGKDAQDPYVDKLKILCTDYPITFLGKVSQQDFFPNVDVVVVPSLWNEPLSRVLFESFANGVPVISSSTGGSPELIEHEVTGWLFAPEQPHQLNVVMNQAISNFDKYESISQTSLIQARQFDPDGVVDQYIAIYTSVLPATTASTRKS